MTSSSRRIPHLLRPKLYLSFALGGALSLAACGGGRPASGGDAERRDAAPATQAPAHGVDPSAIDASVAPGDDFFRYANGAWLKRTAIPEDRSSYGVWSVLFDRAQQRTRELLDKAAAGGAPAASDERKIGDYYATYLDEQAIEKKGLDPLRESLGSIDALADKRALAAWIGQHLRADVDPLNMTNFYTDRLFGVWVAQNLNDPSHNVPYLLQGGLGLPDRDYYVQPGPRMESIRAAYRGHVARVLTLAGLDKADERAAAIFDLERRIANTHATRTDSVDVHRANNPWSREEFGRRAPGLDWNALLAGARLDRAPTIVVWHPVAFRGISALVQSVPMDTWRDYLKFHELDRYSRVLPKAFADESFSFYGKVLSGTPQDQERWKRAVNATNGALGEAVGKLYVQRYFPAQARTQLQEMVSTIVAAFDRRLDALTWMSPKTKASAKAKLASLKVGIGYPDTWRDFSKLEIVRGDALGNVMRASLFDYQLRLQELDRAPDRGQWWLDPQTVNALNLPIQNALNFPAAILEPPFYDPQADAAARYGAIGAIIGHEISHSFDDQGSQFDAAGRLANWWTPEDLAHFKAASAKLVAQYGAYSPFPDLRENGQLTLSENIADAAGLSAAHDAYRAGGGTDDRTFFLSFGQSWQSKTREEAARQQVLTDGHALDEYRADTVRNLDAWYAPFDVKAGQRLYLSPADRVRVW
ncbi:MAG TPA: M13 family metallopeptidase [Vicinamibacterales bacterium]|nr:M13 family metallopeptidase [Vicinamibacterales bacterium]